VTGKRKGFLIAILAIAAAVHISLFAAGGSWRTAGLVLVAADCISVLFVVGAIREFRKLDEKKDPN